MLTHAQIWDAIDLLAAEHGMTVSGLARRSGLDPTTFNRSKRVSREGKARWPSTESIAKILEATATPLDRFYALLRDRSVRQPRAIPLARFDSFGARIGHVAAHVGGTASDRRTAVPLAEMDDPAAFAIEVTGNGLEPVYRHGSILFVSPTVPVQVGDQVLLSTTDGAGYVGKFMRRDQQQVQLGPFAGDGEPRVFEKKYVLTIARITWASL